MINLTNLESHIIAILEEAGEEELVTLINTITTGKGSRTEIKTLFLTLRTLIDRDLIQLAESRDKEQLQWIPLSKERALSILEVAKSFLHWSGAERIWMSRHGAPDVEVLATEAGQILARKILSEYGWDFRHKRGFH